MMFVIVEMSKREGILQMIQGDISQCINAAKSPAPAPVLPSAPPPADSTEVKSAKSLLNEIYASQTQYFTSYQNKYIQKKSSTGVSQTVVDKYNDLNDKYTNRPNYSTMQDINTLNELIPEAASLASMINVAANSL